MRRRTIVASLVGQTLDDVGPEHLSGLEDCQDAVFQWVLLLLRRFRLRLRRLGSASSGLEVDQFSVQVAAFYHIFVC